MTSIRSLITVNHFYRKVYILFSDIDESNRFDFKLDDVTRLAELQIVCMG